jgi:hypothetical protein
MTLVGLDMASCVKEIRAKARCLSHCIFVYRGVLTVKLLVGV